MYITAMHSLVGMSPQVFHVALILEEGLWVLTEEGQVVIFSELGVLAVRLLTCLCGLTRVHQTVNVGRNFVISLEVG